MAADDKPGTKTDVEQLIGILGQFDRQSILAALDKTGVAIALAGPLGFSLAIDPGVKVVRFSAMSSFRLKCGATFTGDAAGDWVMDKFDADDCEFVVRYNDASTQTVKLKKDGKIVKKGETIIASGVKD